MIVSVFFIRVSFSVRLGRVCARYGDDVSTLRERDEGPGVVMEDGGAERETGVCGEGDYLMEIFLTVLPIFMM